MRGKRKTINSNFSAGELDPKLVPMRSDVQAWQQGAKQLINLRPLLHGGVTTRPGSDFVVFLAGDAVLVPFEFSETQGYVLAFGDRIIDCFTDAGVYFAQIVSPYPLADVRLMRFSQAGDTMILCHKNYPIQKLVRTGATTFVLTAFAFDFDPVWTSRKLCPFYRYAPSSVQIAISPTVGNVNVVATGNVFTPAHVGTWIRVEGKQLIVTSYLSPSNVHADIAEVQTATDSVNTIDWDEEAFSPVHGYPQAVCFHNERLVFGGSLQHPSGLWASQVGDFFNFDLADGTDDKAIWIGVAADKVVEILHLASFKHLSIFTDQIEMFQPEGDSQPWSPKTSAIKAQSGFGCQSSVRPARFDEAVLFVQKFGHQVREFLFDAVSQTYSSDAISVMNPARIQSPVSLAGITASRDIDEQYAFIVMTNGGLACLHSLRAQRITAWSWWTTAGLYKQVCAVNGRLFTLVQRTINGATRYALESINYSHALDCARTVAVTVGGSSVSGITHLEGVLAQAVNNGYAHNPDVVQSGVYQLVEDVWGAANSIVGIPFEARLESMPPEIQVDDGSSRGRPVRIVKAGVQVNQSVRLVVEKEGAVITNIDDDYSIPPTPLTGMYDFVLLGFDKSRTVTVRCDVPLQLTVLGLALEVVV